MKNSLLQDESYSTLLKLRKYFKNAMALIPGQESKYQTEPFKILKAYLDDIDEIILDKYLSDTTSFSVDLNPEN